MVFGEHCHFGSSFYELSCSGSMLQIWHWEESRAVCSWVSPCSQTLRTSSVTGHTQPLKCHRLFCSHLFNTHSDSTGPSPTKAGAPRRAVGGGWERCMSYTAAAFGDVSAHCAVMALHTEDLIKGRCDWRPGREGDALVSTAALDRGHICAPFSTITQPSSHSLPGTEQSTLHSCSHSIPYPGLYYSPHSIDGETEAQRY